MECTGTVYYILLHYNTYRRLASVITDILKSKHGIRVVAKSFRISRSAEQRRSILSERLLQCNVYLRHQSPASAVSSDVLLAHARSIARTCRCRAIAQASSHRQLGFHPRSGHTALWRDFLLCGTVAEISRHVALWQNIPSYDTVAGFAVMWHCGRIAPSTSVSRGTR
jgi:hypothetical protein